MVVQSADLGPGMCLGTASAQPTIIRMLASGMAPRMYSVNIQNTGDSTLMLVQHSSGTSSKLGQVPSFTGMSMTVSLGSGDALQVMALGNGIDSRFIWSARGM